MGILKVWIKSMFMNMMGEMAYSTEFIARCIVLLFGNFIAPLVALLIYKTTAGIPGWSFWEFILFQGIFTLLFSGISNMFLWKIVSKVSHGVEEGTFDNVMIKPFPPLLFVSFTSFHFEHIVDMVAGFFLVVLSLVMLKWEFNIVVFPALLIFLAGIIFLYSLNVITASLSFVFVRLHNLIDIFLSIVEFGKYPLTIYGFTMRFFLTFVFPAGVAAFYPASVLIGKESWIILIKIIPSVLAFFVFSLAIWNLLLKKYRSAGG